jgi:hypothetical protein
MIASMTDDDSNPPGGRATLGAVGVFVLLLGCGSVLYGLTYPSAAGLSTYAIGGAFGLVGAVALYAAVTNPDALDIGTRTKPSEAELRERRTDGPPGDDEP